MDNMDDSENNAKVSDSAYSNSCSNSQSRRSHSSKSTHSGSNSSGSSGYGGKQSNSGSSNPQSEKRTKDKNSKKKKSTQTDIVEARVETECCTSDPVVISEPPKEEKNYVDPTPDAAVPLMEKGPESMDIVSTETFGANEEVISCNAPMEISPINVVTSRPSSIYCTDGFSCVISMYDGVVMYTTSSLTNTLGFPKDMWLGRSFIDFIHPRDRSNFASQISVLAVPKNVNNTPDKGNAVSTLVCRIRRYKGLTAGFGVKERTVTFTPFLLKLSFKNVTDEDREIIYLVIQATPFYSAFKVPNEITVKPTPFVMRHTADGSLEYIDLESIPYLGYLPQDLVGKDVFQLYHPDDLCYLRQVYETIVKEGCMPRSIPYRMITQNGNYIKLETEWSSFINPWSRKLDFVIGKHHILEGPINPDVFQINDLKRPVKAIDEEKRQQIRAIIKTMNEVLTKPAEVAKQQMSKRCQDLTTFIESLMEEQPKPDDELRLEIQDPDSYYERDSLLGGISPHHDYNDSKSSTETPLSYNQLNYNDNLQRYFESHQPFSYEDYNTVTGENVLGLKHSEPYQSSSNLSPKGQNKGEVGEPNSCSETGLTLTGSAPGDYQEVSLTESLITKHNADMEKELLRIHRETRSSTKEDRGKTSNQNRQKKKEHLARCNASFQPAAVDNSAPVPDPTEKKPHGVKRALKQADTEVAVKHHCSSPRQYRRRQTATAMPSQTSTAVTNTNVDSSTNMHPNTMTNANNMNTFFLGLGIPQQMPIMSPVLPQQIGTMPGIQGLPVSGIFPMYYTAAPSTTMPSSSVINSCNTTNTNMQHQQQPMPCMMYGHAMYGSPFMYPLGPQVSYPMQQTMMSQSMQYTNALNPLGLTTRNYEEACKLRFPLRPNEMSTGWQDKQQGESQVASKTDQGSADSNASTNVLNRSTEAVLNTASSSMSKCISMRNSEENKTDEEASHSSFYSSFFKTESASAEESGDLKKNDNKKRTASEFWDKNTPDDQSSVEATSHSFVSKQQKTDTRRNMEPPWMEKVCVTSELIYKYQILSKSMEEVLLADKQKLSTLLQPSLVNDQLGQLYLDMQLEGVAAKLTLDEGVTSSSSSGEEIATNLTKVRRKREYSKLSMIYEEDAPLPPPVESDPTTSAT